MPVTLRPMKAPAELWFAPKPHVRFIMRLAQIVVLLVLAATFSGCRRITVPGSAQVADFSKRAMVTLPASAKPIGWRQSTAMSGLTLWLQVRMSAADLPAFLASSPFGHLSALNTNHGYASVYFGDFVPVPPSRYRTGVVSLPDNCVLKMLIDESNPTYVVITLMWYS